MLDTSRRKSFTQARSAVSMDGIAKQQHRHTTAHLYAGPVQAAFDTIRNYSHCRRDTDAGGKVACEGCGRAAARNGWPATIYQFACGLVAYFAPEARDFQEAGELEGDALAGHCAY